MATGAAGENKQRVLEYFGGNFQPFYSKYLPDLHKITGDEWTARCLFHKDRNPSLNANAKTGLFHCHGCGAGGDIFTFYARLHGLSNGDFPRVLEGIAGDFGITLEKLSKNGQHDATHQENTKNTPPGATDHVDHAEGAGHDGQEQPTHENNTKNADVDNKKDVGRIGCTYDYHDEAGALLFQVCRMEPKTFRQRRPDGRGGWVWSLKGVEPVLYHLPEVLAVDEVLLPEGEKDADNLRALGFVATTCPMGAGKWRDNYTETLRGKDVVLLPDNDEPGRKHMLQVAGELHGKAKSVKLLVLPGLPDKGDVSDFIAQYEDPTEAAERLAIMIDGAAPWEPDPEPAESESGNKFADAMITGKALHEKFKLQLGQSWRAKGILPEPAKLIEIYGLPATYKSFIALDLALSIAAGKDWHGRAVKQCGVVYVPAEGQSGALKRIKAWQAYHGIDCLDRFTLLPLPCLIDEPGELQEFIEAIKGLPELPGLVFFDTLARSMAGDENSTSDMGRVVIACGRITQATGAQVTLVHHTGKDTTRGPRGAIALTGATDCLFEVRKDDDRLATLICERQKDDEPFKPLTFRLETQSTGYVNDDLEAINSLVPVYDPDYTRQRGGKGPQIKGANRIALNALQRAVAEHGQAPGPEVAAKMEPVSSGGLAVHEDQWRQMAYDLGISDGGKSARKNAFARARARLMDLEMVGCWDGYYWKTNHAL